MKNRIYIVGMGPGKEEMMTGEALKALEEADVIVGYPVYLNLLGSEKRSCCQRRCGRRKNAAGCALKRRLKENRWH